MGRRKNQSKIARDSFYLPQELCIQILCRLPVKSLLRFRSVCKTWCTLIDNPHFISIHLTHFNNNSDQSRLFLMDHFFPCPKIRFLIRRCGTFRKFFEFELNIQQNESYTVMGYINGVLTLMKLVNYDLAWRLCAVIVWNPSIRKCFELPPTPFSHMSKATLVEPGFGFVRERNEYKVVLIVYPAMKMCNTQVPVLVEVYNTRTGLWKSLGFDVPCLRCLGPCVHLNGAIHWLGCDMRSVPWSGKSSHIVSFDVGNEVFSYKKLPEVEEDDFMRERLPLALGDSLGLLDMYRDHNYIWVMDKGEEREHWSKLYTLDLHFSRFLYLKKDLGLLFATRMEGVQSFNLKSQEKKVLAKTYPEFMVHTDVYVESLVLLKGINGKVLDNFP